MDTVNLLVVVRENDIQRYEENLAPETSFNTQVVADTGMAVDMLADQNHHIDVLVIDNGLGDVHRLVTNIRQTYPRLLIILVDEEADFAMPGQADDITTEPFANGDLVRRISNLLSERQVATLRSDSLPAVRAVAKRLRTATGLGGKEQAAVEAAKDMGYDYVAYYRLEQSGSPKLALKAQVGPPAIQSVAPKQAANDDLMTWVAQTGQSRIVSPQDKPNHPLIAKGRLGAAACVVAAFSGNIYGVLVACRDKPGSINNEHVMMLELVSSQLAAVIAKDSGG